MTLLDSALRLASSQVSLALGLVDADTADELRAVLRRLQAIRRELGPPRAGDGVHLTLEDDEP